MQSARNPQFQGVCHRIAGPIQYPRAGAAAVIESISARVSSISAVSGEFIARHPAACWRKAFRIASDMHYSLPLLHRTSKARRQ
jgi:hypothetical protein